jgi:hypothetical protein
MIGDTKRPVTTTMARSVVDLCQMVKARDARIDELESACDQRQRFIDKFIEADPVLAGRILGGR